MPRYKKVVSENRKAYFDFHILENFEAGVVLEGTEVKSVRMGRVNLKDSYARVEKGEVWLYGMHISPYDFARKETINPLRKRKLLLSKREIGRLSGKANEKGLTLIPLKMYFWGNFAKIDLGVGKGKKVFDKRDSIKNRELDKEAERELVDRSR